MSCYRRLIMIINISISVALGCAGCGGGSKKQSPSTQGRRLGVQRQIAQDLGPGHSANMFMCIRLLQSGDQAVVVVATPKGIPTASNLLRRYNIDGKVEVKTPYEYNTSVVRLGKRIEEERPKTKAFSQVNVAYEVLHDALTCPKATIELGTKGEVSSQVIAWARNTTARYGSDRVKYGYTPMAEAVVARAHLSLGRNGRFSQ
jgi:hypothetical protein